MSIQQMLLGASGASGYLMDKSLRFRASASAYLNRTPASAGNRQIWTWSGWVKRGSLGGAFGKTLFSAYTGSGTVDTSFFFLGFNSSDQLALTGYSTIYRVSSAVYRDPSAWYHLVVAIDTTQATANNRLRIYVNGSEITGFGTLNNPTQNSDLGINQAAPHYQGWDTFSSYFDGYLADVYFIDGQALTPASFGETNALTGVWQPKAYTGTYGTNGFYLDFEDTSSVAALGTDKSGNGNTWTVNNVSLTAGVTYDSMTDVPTLTSETAANYCVLNPLDKSTNWTLSDGNLKCRRSAGTPFVRATMATPATGKFYFEYLQELGTDSNNAIMYGLCSGARGLDSFAGVTGDFMIYFSNNGYLRENGAGTGTIGTVPTPGQIVQIAVDVDNSKMWIGINNSWYIAGGATTGNPSTGANPTMTGALGGLFPMVYVDATVNTGTVVNFGQRPFAYTPPTGFVALNTFNLPTATILKGSNEVNIALDTGANIKTTTEALFSGSQFLEWIKDLANANNHQLMNSVRGLTNVLQTNSTSAETTYSAPSGSSVGFAWKAGASSSSNTDGSITSTVGVNANAGISIVVYNGTGANATVGHGLGVAPKFIMFKAASAVTNWIAYHAGIGATQYVHPNLPNAAGTVATVFNNTAPTSSVFSLGSDATANGSGNTMVAICFADIDGFAKFGAYIGNASADGTFIYTGFRPRLITLKNASAAESWNINDTARSPYNLADMLLFTNANNAQTQAFGIDILSNGFKIRNTGAQSNGSGNTIIYGAWAENPFKNSLAR